jgi:hypothetical protein
MPSLRKLLSEPNPYLDFYSNPNWFVNTHVIKYKKHNKQRIAKMDSQVLAPKKQ